MGTQTYLQNSVKGPDPCALSGTPRPNSTDVHALLIHAIRQAEAKVSSGTGFLHSDAVQLDRGGGEDCLQLLVKGSALVHLRVLGTGLNIKPASQSAK